MAKTLYLCYVISLYKDYEVLSLTLFATLKQLGTDMSHDMKIMDKNQYMDTVMESFCIGLHNYLYIKTLCGSIL